MRRRKSRRSRRSRRPGRRALKKKLLRKRIGDRL